MTTVGKNIRAIRTERGLTLEQVATAANYNAGNLSKLERGQIMWSAAALESLAAAMGVEVRDFFLNDQQRQLIKTWETLGTDERAVLGRILQDQSPVTQAPPLRKMEVIPAKREAAPIQALPLLTGTDHANGARRLHIVYNPNQ